MDKLNSLYVLAQISVSEGDLDLPTGSSEDAGVANLIQWVFLLLAVVSIVVLIIAGINLMTSQGDPEKVKKSRNTVIYAFVGILLAALAFTIVQLIAGRF